LPPISPIMMMASVSASSWNSFSASTKSHAVDRVAADADAGALAEAGLRGLVHGFVGQRAGARHDADLARLVDVAGMMPILHSSVPGVMMPGQFGPIRRVFVAASARP
jgi:hypothetical protein